MLSNLTVLLTEPSFSWKQLAVKIMEIYAAESARQYLYWLFVLITHLSNTLGFDSANSCSSSGKFARQSRAQILTTIPCDLTTQAYCNMPGSAYPWNAVRRFVHENQGLMKRMYGDVRHITILRDEIQDNEIHAEDIVLTSGWYTRDGFQRSAKLKANAEFFGARSNDALLEPHFRPAATSATSGKSATMQRSTVPIQKVKAGDPKRLAIATKLSSSGLGREDSTHRSDLIFDNIKATTTPTPKPTQEIFETIKSNTTTIIHLAENSSINNEKLVDEHKSPEAKISNDALSEYETSTFPEPNTLVGDNIQIVESPRLGLNNITIINTSDPPELATVTKSENPSQLHRATPGSVSENTETSPAAISLKDDNQKTTTNTMPITIPSPPPSISNEPPQVEEKCPEKLVESTESTEEVVSSATATTPILRVEQSFQEKKKEEAPSMFNIRGINACPVKEEVVAPFWANNTRGEILALLNLYPFEQYVHWEKCTFEYKQMYCREGCRCEQQYRLHRLLAYDPHNECRGIFSDWFRFPSCCICKCYDFSYDFRAPSRNAKVEREFQYAQRRFEAAEDNVKKAIYEHATEDWYRPKDDFDLNGG